MAPVSFINKIQFLFYTSEQTALYTLQKWAKKKNKGEDHSFTVKHFA